MATARPPKNTLIEDSQRDSIRKSWHALNPFSKGAISSLPKLSRPAKSTRHDNIPEDEAGGVRNYQAINRIRKPKKIATPIRVEGKVWFANERTWVAWLNLSILMATFAIALFNASKDDISTYFAYVYALISVAIIVYGYVLYQNRISMIRKRYPGSFDALAGPVIISILLFIAVSANFLIRVKQLRDNNPGDNLVGMVLTLLRLDSGGLQSVLTKGP